MPQGEAKRRLLGVGKQLGPQEGGRRGQKRIEELANLGGVDSELNRLAQAWGVLRLSATLLSCHLHKSIHFKVKP